MKHDIERRRDRRVECPAALLIRRENLPSSQAFQELVIKNVSLQGVYFETHQPDAFNLNDRVVASVAIPLSHTRYFPFKRLAGRGRVVRVIPPSSPEAEGQSTGVAVEFGRDVTVLGTIPEYS